MVLLVGRKVSDMDFMEGFQMSKFPWNEVENFVFMIVRFTGLKN